uniref:G-protein coupled receptors family 1 profile domain-containing protein n=1 Tax=Stomoxys calcitrans TaxID=35570 RepID=A0A1I8NW54_STOCA
MASCCSSHCAMGVSGNMPSSSTSSLASSSTTYSYRYQMQQQQYYHHPYNTTRNNCMQYGNSEYYGKSDTGKKLFTSSKRNLRSSDSVLRRNNIAKNLESKKRVVKMLSVLVLEFFICWTPLYVINTVAMYIGSAIYEYIDYKSISALQLLAYSSSCCNPITYCFMNANFRRAFLDTFKGMHWCGKRFRRKRSTAQSGNLCLAGNSSIRVNSCTVQTVIDSPRLYEYIDYKSISALQLLAYSSSCCNPITYCFMNANFRRAFLDTFKGMHWCGKRFRRKRSTAQSGNLCLAGNSSIRVNSCTVQTVIDSPRL